MPQALFSQSVGDCGSNQTHDIALLQASFKSIKNPDETSGDRTWWPEDITGNRTPKLVEAIKAFQTAHGLSPVNGCIRPGDSTERKLQDLLPRERKHMRCFPNSKEVYCFNPQGHLQTASNKALEEDPNLPEDLARNIRRWLDDHSTAQGHCALAEVKTIRPNSVEYFVRCTDIDLLDVKGQRIRNQGISNAERRILAASKQARVSTLDDVKILPSTADLVIEVAVDARKELESALSAVLGSDVLRNAQATVGAFSRAVETEINSGLKTDIAQLQKEVEGRGGTTLRQATARIQGYGSALKASTVAELDHVARRIAEELRRQYGNLEGLLRHISGVAGEAVDVGIAEDAVQRTAVADAIIGAARKAGINPESVGKFMDKLGRRFFLFSLAISIFKIFAADDKVRATQEELVSIVVDAAIAGAVTAAVLVASGPAILAIVLGLAVALIAGDQIDAVKKEILDSARSIPTGAIFSYAGNR